MFRCTFRRIVFTPYYSGYKVLLTEYFIANRTEIEEFCVINTDKDCSILRQQLLQQLQPRVHHAQPLVVAGQVLALFADNLAQPPLDLRVIDIIVINPALVAGVVGRIDVDALDAPLVPGQQCFQGFQIIAPDDHVFAAVILAVLPVFIKAVLALQHPERNFLMVTDHLALSNPFKCWHGYPPFAEPLYYLVEDLQI